MTAPGNEFDDLVRRARAGDHDALGQLSQQYESEIRIVARSLLGPALRQHLDSVDLVQSVHRTLMLGLRKDRFDVSTPESLLALAMTLLRRKVARHWRKARRQKRLSGEAAENGELSRIFSSLSIRYVNPGQQSEVNEQIEKFLTGLSATDRRLVELRMEGNTTAAAARVLDQEADVLRVRLSRLRKRLLERGWDAHWL